MAAGLGLTVKEKARTDSLEMVARELEIIDVASNGNIYDEINIDASLAKELPFETGKGSCLLSSSSIARIMTKKDRDRSTRSTVLDCAMRECVENFETTHFAAIEVGANSYFCVPVTLHPESIPCSYVIPQRIHSKEKSTDDDARLEADLENAAELLGAEAPRAHKVYACDASDVAVLKRLFSRQERKKMERRFKDYSEKEKKAYKGRK